MLAAIFVKSDKTKHLEGVTFEQLISIYNQLFILYQKHNSALQQGIEFRNLSYECYAHMIKKHPYLKGQTELLFFS